MSLSCSEIPQRTPKNPYIMWLPTISLASFLPIFSLITDQPDLKISQTQEIILQFTVFAPPVLLFLNILPIVSQITYSLTSLKTSDTPSKMPFLRTEELGGLKSMGSLRVGHDWVTSLSLFTFMHWRKKWQPTPLFLPGESQGQGSLVGCRLWGLTESDTLKRLSSSSRS